MLTAPYLVTDYFILHRAISVTSVVGYAGKTRERVLLLPASRKTPLASPGNRILPTSRNQESSGYFSTSPAESKIALLKSLFWHDHSRGATSLRTSWTRLLPCDLSSLYSCVTSRHTGNVRSKSSLISVTTFTLAIMQPFSKW